MRRRRLELPWVAPLAPQASVSTNSTIAAYRQRVVAAVLTEMKLSDAEKKVKPGLKKGVDPGWACYTDAFHKP